MPDLLFGLRAMMERMAREKEKLNLAGLQYYVEQWKICRARSPKQSKAKELFTCEVHRGALNETIE